MPEDALELKKNLRCDMKARRNALTDEEKKHAAANCLSKLKELPEFMNADWIYAYIACRNELETADIISWCLSYGKHVAVPKVQGEIMHFYEITVLSDCVPGAFGILEPAGEKKTESQLQALCLSQDLPLIKTEIVLDTAVDSTINISHPMRRL